MRLAASREGSKYSARTRIALTMDSKGNLYTGEAATAGRVQKFSLKE
jgi:hypothetical protein